MKIIELVLLVTVASASWLPGYLQDEPKSPSEYRCIKQLQVLQLLYKIYQPLTINLAVPKDRLCISLEHLKEVSDQINPLEHLNEFSDDGESLVKLMKELLAGNLLVKKSWFSLFNNRHREEAIMLFDVLISCKHWRTLSHVAAYFRERMNEGEFVYAFSTAVVHSKLSQDVVLPPLYETTPHLFTSTDVIRQAYASKMIQEEGHFQMNHTGTKKNPEYLVAYFREDVGINHHHVLWHMNYPFWWNDTKYKHSLERKGEYFFWAHHQLTIRYDAERLSNNLSPVEELSWDKPLAEGIVPHLEYNYDGDLPSRADNINIQDVDGVITVKTLKDFERRIHNAIDYGYVQSARDQIIINIKNERGIDILGDIVEASEYSVNPDFYGSLHNLGHIIIGEQGDPNGKYGLPSGAMEHFETSIRDPEFFNFHKYIDQLFKEHKDTLTPYKKEDVEFKDISLTSVTVYGKLETFFENFEYSIIPVLDDTNTIPNVNVTSIVKRINHKPFLLNFHITSNRIKAVEAIIRVYLCPKKDENGVVFDFNESRWGCIELDKIWTRLTHGDNHVKRKSVDASTTTEDPLGYRQMMIRTIKGEPLSRNCGFPNRILLPKGTPEGMEFDLFVAVTEGPKDVISGKLDAALHNHFHCLHVRDNHPDERPLGYPLDRRVPDERVLLDLPNVHRSVVKVTHRVD